MTKKKKAWLFFLFWSIFSIVNLRIMYNRSLSGKSLSTTLITETFKNINISILVPDDWIIYDVTNSSEYGEGINTNLIIQGGKPAGSLPWLKIFQFDQNSDQFQSIDEIIYSDILRINNEYQLRFIDVVDRENHTDILFEYPYGNSERVKSCIDRIGEKDGFIFITSICATSEQWEVIEPIYDQIVNSITVN
ncbi:hypothetical protein JR338_01960 [Chloroflexota bacterium]|nr:hypothetical protein JR338_01960 [Chloroflexota bacterium]